MSLIQLSLVILCLRLIKYLLKYLLKYLYKYLFVCAGDATIPGGGPRHGGGRPGAGHGAGE